MRLGKTWHLGSDREHPDFLVTEDEHLFGLEVCEIFTGSQGRSGSTMKKNESDIQRTIEALRQEYEAISNIPLTVKLVGKMCAVNLATIVPALVGEQLGDKPVGHHVVLDGRNGLRAYITKALRPDWYSINDRVGWVDRDPMPRIEEAVGEKANKLPQYRKAAGLDIRLLLIADRFNNSGKLRLEQQCTLDFRGFRVVYFYSRPESVIIFDCAGNAA